MRRRYAVMGLAVVLGMSAMAGCGGDGDAAPAVPEGDVALGTALRDGVADSRAITARIGACAGGTLSCMTAEGPAMLALVDTYSAQLDKLTDGATEACITDAADTFTGVIKSYHGAAAALAGGNALGAASGVAGAKEPTETTYAQLSGCPEPVREAIGQPPPA